MGLWLEENEGTREQWARFDRQYAKVAELSGYPNEGWACRAHMLGLAEIAGFPAIREPRVGGSLAGWQVALCSADLETLKALSEALRKVA